MTSGPVRSGPPERAADWSGRLSGRRRSSQQSPAALLANFDTTVQQNALQSIVRNGGIRSRGVPGSGRGVPGPGRGAPHYCSPSYIPENLSENIRARVTHAKMLFNERTFSSKCLLMRLYWALQYESAGLRHRRHYRVIAHFTSGARGCRALQIRDWVSVEVDMLRTQSVAVGDVDEILQQLDKQKVSATVTVILYAGNYL
ncbi:unnamed protein product [Spodoptera exigua]|nr:unnamed protein product [Spodoptera exigua]